MSKDRQLTLYLNGDYQLSIRPKYARKAYILDSVTVLRLANLLHDEYKELAMEAKKHNGLDGSGPKRDGTYSLSGM